MANLLIVESENDKYFVEAVINHLNLQKDITVEDWKLSFESEKIIENDEICINAYECIGGTGNLKETLNTLKNKIIKNEIEKIGIVFDQDNHATDKRLSEINVVIAEVFGQNAEQLKSINSFIDLDADEDNRFKLACYLMNLNGQGELDNVLKEIATNDSTHADCLNNWLACLKDRKKEFKSKDLLKEWVRVYVRYDTCKGRDRNQANRKCNLKAALQKPVWNFNHDCLNELKIFLNLFKNEEVV
jgi:hypothetical protein